MSENETNGGGQVVERAVGERGDLAAARPARSALPDPELVERARRRRFTAEYKLRILQQAEACTRPGEIGALLRREGLYTSHLTAWRKQREQGALAALGRPRGRPKGDGEQAQVAALRAGAERAEAELRRRGG